MRLALCLFVWLLPSALSRTRTSCFHYVTCMEEAHKGLQQCAGGTSLALALEAKEKPFADFTQEHRTTTISCQEQLLADSFDFEVLQFLVNEDARECFERLPRNRSRSSRNPAATCPYREPPAKSHSAHTPFECFSSFRSERQKCEALLQCCPEHLRCAERLNSVSVAYQHAKSRANELVQRLLLCLGSVEPQSFLEIAAMQVDGMRFRVPGLPFLKPDRETEQRIARRLSLMSYSAIEHRREKHVKRFQQVRDRLLSRKQTEVINLTTPSSRTTPISSEERVAIVRNLFRNANEKELATYASLLAAGNFARLAELEKRKSANNTGSQMQRFREAIKASLLSKNSKTFDFLESSTAVARALFRSPAETEEARRSIEFPTGNVGNDALPRPKEYSQQEQAVHIVDSSSGQEFNSLTHGLRNTAIEKVDPLRGLFDGRIINLLKEDKQFTATPTLGLTKVYKSRPLPLAGSRTISVSGKSTTNAFFRSSEVEHTTTVTIPMRPQPSTKGLHKSVKDSHHSTAKRKNKNSTRNTKCNVQLTTGNPTTTTASVTTTVVETNATTGAVQQPHAIDENEMEGSTVRIEQGPEAVAADLLTAEASTSPLGSQSIQQNLDNNLSLTTAESPTATADPTQKFHDEPSQGSFCATYAVCLETIRDYEDACEQRYAKDYIAHECADRLDGAVHVCPSLPRLRRWLTHPDVTFDEISGFTYQFGIDDNEILRILNASSIDHGMIVHKACLRSIDKIDYAMVKQLLLTQRSLRKRCLEHGTDRRNETEREVLNCSGTLPSTETIDNFLYQTHYRLEDNRLTCHALLNEMRAACTALEKCCASASSCESQVRTSSLNQRLENATERLISRHNICEQNMLETLKLLENFGDEEQ